MRGAESYPQASSGRVGDRWRFVGGLCLGPDAQRRADLGFDLAGDLRVLDQELLGVVSPLPEPQLAVGEERSRLLHQVVLDAEVEQLALARDAGAVLDLELGLAERRRHLVLD